MKRLLLVLVAVLGLVLLLSNTALAASTIPENYVETPEVRVVDYYPLIGPDTYVRLLTHDGDILHVIVDDPCLAELLVDLDGLNTYQAYYVTENTGGGADGDDMRFVTPMVPRLIVDNRVGL